MLSVVVWITSILCGLANGVVHNNSYKSSLLALLAFGQVVTKYDDISFKYDDVSLNCYHLNN